MNPSVKSGSFLPPDDVGLQLRFIFVCEVDVFLRRFRGCCGFFFLFLFLNST